MIRKATEKQQRVETKTENDQKGNRETAELRQRRNMTRKATEKQQRVETKTEHDQKGNADKGE